MRNSAMVNDSSAAKWATAHSNPVQSDAAFWLVCEMYAADSAKTEQSIS